MHTLEPLSVRTGRRPQPQRRGRAGLAGALCGLCALGLYAATGARGVEWQDPGIHQYRILTGQLEHPLGLALSHPLHYWLGRALLHLPLGDPLWRLNLLSAIGGALGVGVLTGLVARLTRSPVAGVLAGAAVGLAHSYWQMSALTETYTVAAALMTIEWALLLRYVRTRRPIWLTAVLAANGLHVADHLLGLLTLATYGGLLVERLARRRLALFWLPIIAALWIGTASPYWTVAVRHYQRTGELCGTLRSALFGGGPAGGGWQSQVLTVSISPAQLELALLTFGYCFPSATGLLALLGLLRPTRGCRPMFRWVLTAQTVIIVGFVGRYQIRDLYTYFVPVCTLTALWFGLGVSRLLRPRHRSTVGRRCIIVLLMLNTTLPPAVYAVFPQLAQQRGWMRAQMRDIPYRNEYRSFFQPWRFLDDSAARMAEDALTQVGPGGWILADSTTAFPVAVTLIQSGHQAGQRVYWLRSCLTELGQPSLTDAELVEHLRHGRRVLAVPSPQIERMIAPPLAIEKTEPFWEITALPPSTGGSACWPNPSVAAPPPSTPARP